MKQLEQTITRLKLDPLNAVCVSDGQYGTRIAINATGEQLADKYGSVEGFFEQLVAKGCKTLIVTDKRRNGSTYRSMGEYRVDVQDNAPAEPVAAPAAIPVTASPMPAMPGFPAGLGIGMNMDFNYKAMDHSRLVQEVTELKSENTRLKEKVEELKEKDLQHRYSTDKAKTNVDLITQLSPLLMGVIQQKFGGSAPGAPALNAPTMTPAQTAFMGIVQQADDAFLTDLLIVVQGMQNPEFDQELSALIEKYNLKPVTHA